MEDLNEDARKSTQLEGKKLKGFGARMREAFDLLLRPATKEEEQQIELDNERGFLEEEIIFDENGKEQEERKKREAMRQANRMQKQVQRVSILKGRKAAKERDGNDSLINEKGDYKKEKSVDAKEEPKQTRENNLKAEMAGQNVENKVQQEIAAPEKTPVLKEGQQMQQSAVVRSEALEIQTENNKPITKNDVPAMEALVGKDNIKNLDRSTDLAAAAQQQEVMSPVKGVSNVFKDLLNAVLPTQLPDVRGDKDKGGPQVG